jgi:hypothetical protein
MKTKNTLEVPNPKFLRVHDIKAIYGITDTGIYRLISAGLIKTVDVRRPGCSRGVRLVDVASLDAYLAKLAEEQN